MLFFYANARILKWWITKRHLNKPYQGFDNLNLGETVLDYKNRSNFLIRFATLFRSDKILGKYQHRPSDSYLTLLQIFSTKILSMAPPLPSNSIAASKSVLGCLLGLA